MATPKKYTELQGLGRAIAILDAIAEKPRKAKELSETLDLKWTTTYRTLTFLRDSGYINHDNMTGVYSVGTRLHSIGTSYLATHPLVPAARATIRNTAEASGSTVQLVERDQTRTVVLVAAEPGNQTISRATPGFHFPLHCGSKGHVLLAFAPDDFQKEYLASELLPMTPESLTDPVALARKLETIRQEGYAVTQRDIQLSTGSVAAPIRNSKGEVEWCICLVTGANDLNEREYSLVEIALQAAQSLTTIAGWRPHLTVQ